MILSNLSKDSSKDTRCDPEFYARNNEDQCRLSLKALDMVDKDLEQRHDTNLKFLDIGCGTGDFTYRWLLPRCPPCARIIAVDSSEEMLSYARKMFVHPRIEYDRMDISGDVDKFIAKYGRFDRIYSFFCLNWVRDQGQAMRNRVQAPVIRWRVCSRLPSLVPFEDALDEPGTSQSLAQV
ncbi:hypothetical protein MTO96_041740 [Rhipicephalus appendiculatus]